MVTIADHIRSSFAFAGGPLLEAGGDALGGVIGCDTFAAEIINPVVDFFVYNTVAKYALFQIIEQAIDKGRNFSPSPNISAALIHAIGLLEHILPEEEKMLRTTSMRTLQCVVKHKLMDVDADLRLARVVPSQSPLSCEKGWFCPYLFASSRTPIIPRSQEFTIAQCFGPFLAGDYQLAHKLLSESAAVLSLCNPDPTVNIGVNRVLVTFIGITPYRGGMWSSSRRPGAALMNFHLLNGCPSMVIPVNNMAPIVAWSPTTLASIKKPEFNPEWWHGQICDFLDSIISIKDCAPGIRANYEPALGRAASMVVNGALGLRNVQPGILKGLDPERAG